MSNIVCLARAYGDRPLRRYIVGRGPKLVYIANPSYVDASGIPENGGVGFPQDCIFQFEKSLYDKLLAAYESNDSPALGTLWRYAQALDVPNAV